MNLNGIIGSQGAPRASSTPSSKTFSPVPENATPVQKENLGRLKKLSKEYESFFMKQVISSMRKTVPQDGAIGGGNAEEIYKSMQDDHLASNMANQGNTGIAQSLYNKLSATYLSTPVNNVGKTK